MTFNVKWLSRRASSCSSSPFQMPSFHHSERFSLKSPVLFVQILFMLIHDVIDHYVSFILPYLDSILTLFDYKKCTDW